MIITWPHPISSPEISTVEQFWFFHVKVTSFLVRPVSFKNIYDDEHVIKHNKTKLKNSATKSAHTHILFINLTSLPLI